jgi:hypothetical protein
VDRVTDKVKISKHIDDRTNSSLLNYGTHAYNSLTHKKINILKKKLSENSFIHFIDSDVVCIKEPSEEHYEKYKNYDIVFQYDAGFYDKQTPHSHPVFHHIWTCTGNFTLRNTDSTINLLDRIAFYQEKYPNKNDQECLYQMFYDENVVDISKYDSANLYTYEFDEYTNGYWLNHDIGELSNTYFFHANHVVGPQEKVRLLRKSDSWYL